MKRVLIRYFDTISVIVIASLVGYIVGVLTVGVASLLLSDKL